MMESMFRWLAAVLVLLALAWTAAFVAAGRSAPPTLTIDKPDRPVGQTGTLEVTAAAPGARLRRADDHARTERPDASRSSRSTAPQTASDDGSSTPRT